MHLAVIKNSTNKVENCIVPPEGAQVWFCPTGYTAIETDVGKIGDTWDAETETFIPPTPPTPPEE